MEQFLQGVPQDVRMYLSERRVGTITEATSLAEDFVLISKQGKDASGRQGREGVISRPNYGERGQHHHRQTRCLKCGGQNHLAWQCKKNAGAKSEHGSTGAKSMC